MTTTLGIGVIGMGWMGTVHGRSYRMVHDRFHDYPTGAALVCEFDTDSWAGVEWFQGTVVDFVIPRELMAET